MAGYTKDFVLFVLKAWPKHRGERCAAENIPRPRRSQLTAV